VPDLNNQFSDYAKYFKALSDNHRLDILFCLYQNDERCVCSLAEHFEMAQSALSYHLKILVESGFLIKRQDAVWNYYSINRQHCLYSMLERVFEDRLKVDELDLESYGDERRIV
jgi:ArsR family transcriptional regulator, arsenate/arsenite/antimonite-responsive transcriptional repressor